METTKKEPIIRNYYILFTLIIVFVVLISLLIYNQDKFNKSQQIRYESRATADELRQSSDDLTRGLGLSISYGIIEKHRGKIEVKSQVRKGSEFIISLPISSS